MGQCGYWWIIDTDEWCDLADESCSCKGFQGRCPLGAQAISAAKMEEKANLAEAASRARRRRFDKEAS